MKQDEPIKPDDDDAVEQVDSVEAVAPTDVDSSETETEPTPPNVDAKPTAEQRNGGMKWLVRTGVQAATVVIAAGLIFFLLGVAQRTKWLTADGFSGGASEAVAESSGGCLLYTSPSPRDLSTSRMPSSA